MAVGQSESDRCTNCCSTGRLEEQTFNSFEDPSSMHLHRACPAARFRRCAPPSAAHSMSASSAARHMLTHILRVQSGRIQTHQNSSRSFVTLSGMQSKGSQSVSQIFTFAHPAWTLSTRRTTIPISRCARARSKGSPCAEFIVK